MAKREFPSAHPQHPSWLTSMPVRRPPRASSTTPGRATRSEGPRRQRRWTMVRSKSVTSRSSAATVRVERPPHQHIDTPVTSFTIEVERSLQVLKRSPCSTRLPASSRRPRPSAPGQQVRRSALLLRQQDGPDRQLPHGRQVLRGCRQYARRPAAIGSGGPSRRPFIALIDLVRNVALIWHDETRPVGRSDPLTWPTNSRVPRPSARDDCHRGRAPHGKSRR
jgi:hypothetical protein